MPATAVQPIADSAAALPCLLPCSAFIKEHNRSRVSEQLRSMCLQRCPQAARSDWHSSQPYAVAMADGGQTLVCAFMGTYSIADILTDADVRATKSFIPSIADGGVHSGMAARAKLISLAPFIEAMRPSTVGATPKRLLFTGHSLGGGIATLVTLRLLKLCAFSSEEVSRVRCITFAMPLVLDKQLAEALSEDSRLFNVFHSVVNSGDLIPSVLAYPLATLQLLLELPKASGGQSDGGTSSPIAKQQSRTLPAQSRLSSASLLDSSANGADEEMQPQASSLRRQSSYEWEKQLSGPLEGLERHMLMQFGHRPHSPLFRPFGRYYVLADGKVTTLDDSDVILTALRPSPVALADAATRHSCLAYHQALCAVTSTTSLSRIPHAKLASHPVWTLVVSSARLTVNPGGRSMKLEVRGANLAWVVQMKLVGIAAPLVAERHTNTSLRVLRIVPHASEASIFTAGSAPLTLRLMTDFDEVMVTVAPPQAELRLGVAIGGPSLGVHRQSLGGAPTEREAPSAPGDMARPCPSIVFSVSLLALQELLNGVFHALHALIHNETVPLLPVLGQLLFSSLTSTTFQEALAEGGYMAKPSVFEIDRLRLREIPQIRVDASSNQARRPSSYTHT